MVSFLLFPEFCDGTLHIPLYLLLFSSFIFCLFSPFFLSHIATGQKFSFALVQHSDSAPPCIGPYTVGNMSSVTAVAVSLAANFFYFLHLDRRLERLHPQHI